MRSIYILAIICVIGISIVSAEPTARTYIFAAMESNFNDALIDSLAKYFDVVITHEGQREYNPMFRDSNEVTWRRNEPPWVFLYKDAMTLVGPVVDTITGDTTYWGDKSIGGGATVGGFLYFDPLFFVKKFRGLTYSKGLLQCCVKQKARKSFLKDLSIML